MSKPEAEKKAPAFNSQKLKKMKQYNKGTFPDGKVVPKKEDTSPLVALDVGLSTKYVGIGALKTKVLTDMKTKLAAYIKLINTSGLKETYGQPIEDAAAVFANQYTALIDSPDSFINKCVGLPETDMYFYKKNGILDSFTPGVVEKYKRGMGVLDVLLAMYIQRKAMMDYAKANPGAKKTIVDLYKYTGDVKTREMIIKQKKLIFDDDFDVKERKKGGQKFNESTVFKMFGSIPFIYVAMKDVLKAVFPPEFRTGLAICMISGGIPPVFTTVKFWLEEDYQKSKDNIGYGSFTLSKTGLRYSKTKDHFDPYEDEIRGKIFLALDNADRPGLEGVISEHMETATQRRKQAAAVQSGTAEVQEQMEETEEDDGFSEEV